MSSTDTASQVRERVRRYLSLRVLVLWCALTAFIPAFVYVSVVPWYGRHGVFGTETVFPFLAGLIVFTTGAIVLTAWSDRKGSALASMSLIGLAALPLPILACIAPGCSGVKELHVFYDWSVFGPAISASFDADRCAYICPHRVQLVPLFAGYILLADVVTA